MERIVHIINEVNFANLSDKFRKEGFEAVLNEKTNSLKLTKNGQAVEVCALTGGKVFELEASIPFYLDVLMFLFFLGLIAIDQYFELKSAVFVLILSFIGDRQLRQFKEKKYEAPCQVLFDEIRDILRS